MVSVVNNYFLRTTAVPTFALFVVIISVLTAGNASAAPDDGQNQGSLSGSEAEGQERLIRSPALGGNFFRLNTARGFGKRSGLLSSTSSTAATMPLAARIAAAIQQQRQRNSDLFDTSNDADAPTSSDTQLYNNYYNADSTDAFGAQSADSAFQSRPSYYAGSRSYFSPSSSSRMASLPLGLSTMAYIPYAKTLPAQSLHGFRNLWRNSE